MAVTASYMARCSSAKVIGVQKGAISLAAAAFEAATLHAEMTSGFAANDGRTYTARMTTAMSHAAMRANRVHLIRNLPFASVILPMPVGDSSAPGLSSNPLYCALIDMQSHPFHFPSSSASAAFSTVMLRTHSFPGWPNCTSLCCSCIYRMTCLLSPSASASSPLPSIFTVM